MFGQKEKFIDALIKDEGKDWSEVFDKMFHKKTKEFNGVKMSIKEKLFNDQIDKDLKDGEANFLIKQSPAIFINSHSNASPLEIKELPEEIKKQLLKHSL